MRTQVARDERNESVGFALNNQWELRSPGGNLTLGFELSGEGSLFYHVRRYGLTILEKSAFGVVSDKVDFSLELAFCESEERTIDETYVIPAFKAEKCHNHCSVLVLTFEKNGNRLRVEGRAFNDGVALRATLLGEGAGEIRSEKMSYRLPEDIGDVYAQKFIHTYEDTYDTVPHDDLFQNPYGMPVLAQSDRHTWMLLTEADVMGYYCGSNLQSSREDPRNLAYRFSPDQIGGIRQQYPMRTPWRVAIVGTLADIVTSCLLENLNPPCALEDTSWIKPGWGAWSCLAEIKSMPHSEMRMHEKDYIDFAAAMRWPYNVLDWLWPKLDVPELIAYGKERGVDLWLWDHRENFTTEDKVRARLSKWSEWGIVGIKIDFFDSDSQTTNGYVEMILKLAAEYKLMVNFHGSTKPAGEQRTYPHLLSREGIFGAEFQEPISVFLPGPDASHNCTVPFTRNSTGPMDYTPVMLKTFKTFTTDMHQFALAVIFESHIQHFADSPDALEDHPAREFLVGIPAAWDEMRLLEGSPAKYVTIARRKGDVWYLASICAKRPRVVSLALDFLDEGCDYCMTAYADGFPENTDPVNLATGVVPRLSDEKALARRIDRNTPTQHGLDPHAVRTAVRTVRKGSEISFPLLINGGLCIKLVKGRGESCG